MKHFFTKILLALGIAQMASCQSEAKPGVIQKIDKATVLENVVGKEVQLIDVRTPKEFDQGHLEGALNYNISDKSNFLKQIENLNKEEAVYLYCKMGGRSNSAAKLMQKQGFLVIYDYSGGYRDWVK